MSSNEAVQYIVAAIASLLSGIVLIINITSSLFCSKTDVIYTVTSLCYIGITVLFSVFFVALHSGTNISSLKKLFLRSGLFWSFAFPFSRILTDLVKWNLTSEWILPSSIELFVFSFAFQMGIGFGYGFLFLLLYTMIFNLLHKKLGV